MRITIVNWSSRKIGGSEDYLGNLIPELHARGHQVSFAYEVSIPADREPIELPPDAPDWDASRMGEAAVFEAIREWKPDLIYAHGRLSNAFEQGYLGIAPAIYFSHNYYGACISGLKTTKFPVIQPCSRKFGAACLLHYLPRNCGGRSPITMFKLYAEEKHRLKNLHRYDGIVTHSSHMRNEYLREGLPPERVHNFQYEVHQAEQGVIPETLRLTHGVRRLLYVGRMERLKGGVTLLQALPEAARRLACPLELSLLGDGPDRRLWEQLAQKISGRNPAISIRFEGWTSKTGLRKYYRSSDLLVVPSLWPEPFGRIGPEAGSNGLPAAAFAVGGVTDWLINGVNGFLAPGTPPTAAGLTDAIVSCLRDPLAHRKLRVGARNIAAQFTMENHMTALTRIFESVTDAERFRAVSA